MAQRYNYCMCQNKPEQNQCCYNRIWLNSFLLISRAVLITSATVGPEPLEVTSPSSFQPLRQPNWFALFFLPLLSVLGFIGNSLVCIAIYTDRRLHNVTNYFLFSLAIADLLVCALVMPISIIAEVRNGQFPCLTRRFLNNFFVSYEFSILIIMNRIPS